MTPQNPLAPQSMEDPLPLLSSIRLLKSSPRRSQPPSIHVPEYLDSLLPLPMLQYPQDPPLPPTTSSPSDKCLLDQSIAQLPATTSLPTPTDPSLTDWLSPPKPAPIASSKTWQPKKRTTKRSWMTMKRRSSSWKPASLDTSTPSPNLPKGTSRTVDSPPSPSPVEGDYQTQPSGSRSSMMVGWRGTPPRTALTTSRTCARSMHPPSIQLTLWSLYPIGSTKPFKGQPPDMLPSLMQSRLWTIGGSKLTLSALDSSMSASLPTKPNSTAPTASLKAPSLPETNAEEGWSVCDFLSGFRIWQENRCACLQLDGPVGDGRRDEDVTSKQQCDVIDLTNEDSSSNEEEL